MGLMVAGDFATGLLSHLGNECQREQLGRCYGVTHIFRGVCYAVAPSILFNDCSFDDNNVEVVQQHVCVVYN